MFIPTWIALAEEAPLPCTPALALPSCHPVVWESGGIPGMPAISATIDKFLSSEAQRQGGMRWRGGLGGFWGEGGCHRLLVSIPHLWTVTGACGHHPPDRLKRSISCCIRGKRETGTASGVSTKGLKKGKALKKEKRKKKESDEKSGLSISSLTCMYTYLVVSPWTA